MRIVVVGAGVLGSSLALHLKEGGADVTLVDAVGPGSGTSSRGAGLVSEAGWHPTSIALTVRSLQLLGAFAKDAGPFTFKPVGSTTLLAEGQVAHARELAKVQRAAGAEVREVAPERVLDLPRHEGIRVDDVALALHYPRDAWSLPRQYSEFVSFYLESEGAKVVKGAAHLTIKDGRARVTVGGEDLRADAVVAACGVQTRAFLKPAGLDAPLLAYRTQAIRVVHPKASDVPILHDGPQGCYLRPHFTGQMLVGNGTTTTPEDPARWNADADKTFIDASLRRVHHRFPAFTEARPGDAWAGIDAATPDRLLLAGPHPQQRDVWLLAGGNGHGFMRAPATGESMAAIMLGKAPRIDLKAYDPARFAGAMSASFSIQEGYAL